MKIVLVTGGFDPIHSGHLAYFLAAKQLGDLLIVGVNSDNWLSRKKGRPFMPMHERLAVVRNIKCVDQTLIFNDNDNTACDAIYKVKHSYPNAKIIFANGGDRTAENIPEMRVEDVEFVFGVGGSYKKNSSSKILYDWANPLTNRAWGHYQVLFDHNSLDKATKVKTLTVEPNQRLSLQKHQERSEYWFVVSGSCDVYGLPNELKQTLHVHDTVKIDQNQWHQLTNPYSVPCVLVEIQYGSRCEESDIERKVS